MNSKSFKICVYIILVILILIFYTKEIDFTSDTHYKDIKIITEPDIHVVLVNKNYKLPDNYIPEDLEPISVLYSNEDKYLRKEAKEAFENLSQDASALGYKIVAVSAYRDYNYQDKLYNNYIEEKGMIMRINVRPDLDILNIKPVLQ